MLNIQVFRQITLVFLYIQRSTLLTMFTCMKCKHIQVCLKVLFLVLTGLLIFDEVLQFLSKPTHTSISNIKLEPKHFPVFTVCQIPAYNLSMIR